jgi:hypothetical protein
MTANYSHGGPEWDEKLRKAVTRLDQAFRLSYGLSYERKAVAAALTQVPDFSGEPPGTRTQGPRLKSSNTRFTQGRDFATVFPLSFAFRELQSVPLIP